MAIVNIRAFNGELNDTPNTVIYTVGESKRLTVTSITAANRDPAIRQVNVYLDSSAVIPGTAVDPAEVFGISIGHVLEATETITAWLGSGQDDVDLIVSGVLEDV